MYIKKKENGGSKGKSTCFTSSFFCPSSWLRLEYFCFCLAREGRAFFYIYIKSKNERGDKTGGEKEEEKQKSPNFVPQRTSPQSCLSSFFCPPPGYLSFFERKSGGGTGGLRKK